MRTLVLTLILVTTALAASEAEYKKHEKWYGLFKLNECLVTTFQPLFDNRFDEIARTEGLILQLSCTEADSELISILGRFWNYKIEKDSVTIVPTGNWTYPKPLVLMVSEKIKDSELLQVFLKYRPYADLESSSDLDSATAKLKILVQRKAKIEHRNLEKLFETPPSGKKDSPIAPPVTPTPK